MHSGTSFLAQCEIYNEYLGIRNRFQHQVLKLTQLILTTLCFVFITIGRCDVWKETVALISLGFGLSLTIIISFYYCKYGDDTDHKKSLNLIVHMICAVLHEIPAFCLIISAEIDIKSNPMKMYDHCSTNNSSYILKIIAGVLSAVNIFLHARSAQLFVDSIQNNIVEHVGVYGCRSQLKEMSEEMLLF